MAGFSDRFERRVLPRWHESANDTLIRESRSLMQGAPRFILGGSDLQAELQRTHSVGVATDALNVSIIIGNKEMAQEAAGIIMENAEALPVPLVSMAKGALGIPPEEFIIPASLLDRHKQRIRDLRILLRSYPSSPLLHLDMARSLVIVGQTGEDAKGKAYRSIAAARTVAPHSRIVLRAAARFLVNAGKKEEAYNLISNAARTRHDPWLMAAEVAIGQGLDKSPRFWKIGKEFIERGKFAPLHLSELSVAMGTQELISGSRKNARKFFATGLLDPTENALAQARWAETTLGAALVGDASILYTDKRQAFEAEFLRYFNSADMLQAVECGERWYEFEPFSSVAASAVAHVAGLIDDYSRAEQYALQGLMAHPNEPSLHNNLIYARISSGKLLAGKTPEQAMATVQDTVRKLKSYAESEGLDSIHAIANLGLLAFRIGQPEDGRMLYEEAIRIAQKMKQPPQAATASVFFAREALLAGVEWAPQIVEVARTLTKNYIGTANSNAPSVAFYMQKIEALAKDPGNAAHILSVQSARDFAPEKPPVNLRLAKKDGKFVVWVPPSALR